jgi:hypothetical protein
LLESVFLKANSMNFKSKINDLGYNICLGKGNVYTNENEIRSFKITIPYHYGGQGRVGILNIYPIYNENLITNWNVFNDLDIPSDLKSYCDRLIKNIMLL